MTAVDVNLAEAPELTIAPEGVYEVLQNVRIILATRVGSVPLDRDFGVSWHFIDMGTPQAKAEMAAEIFDKVQRYEPRCVITGVEWLQGWDEEMAGRLVPKVTLEIEL